MAVRPFYIRARMEGRATPLAAGPRSGSFEAVVTVRDHGKIRTALYVDGIVLADGSRKLVVETPDGARIFEGVYAG